jgi:hypothetical protein
MESYFFLQVGRKTRPIGRVEGTLRAGGDYEESLEARGGIEPPNKGFADLCLTTWLPRPV